MRNPPGFAATTEDPITLRHTIRDVVALSTLPALWVGRAPREVLESLIEALHQILRGQWVYATLTEPSGEASEDTVRAAWADGGPPEIATLAEALDRLPSIPGVHEVALPATEGTLRVVLAILQIEGSTARLACASRRADFPRDDERLLIDVAANQAAVGVRAARLLAARDQAEQALRVSNVRLEEESRSVELLRRVGLVLAAQLDLQPLLQQITEAATSLSRAQFGSFFYSPQDVPGEAFQLYTLSGAQPEAFARFPMPRNTPLFGPTFRGEGVVRSDDITRDARYGHNPPYYGIPDGHLAVRSYLAVPVVSRSGEVLGGLFFGHADPGVFAEREERLVAGVAAYAATALDNARLYEAARGRLNELVGLQQLGAILLEEHDVDRVLQAVCVQLQHLTDAEGVALGLLDENARDFDLRGAVGPGAATDLGARVAAEGSFAGEAVRTNRAVRSDDAQHDPRAYASRLTTRTARAVLSVPMRTRRRVVGAITMYNKRSAPGFTERDADLALLFAQQAAVAVENARLYEAARGKAALEERQTLARELHDSVSQALFAIELNASVAGELVATAPERASGLVNDVVRLAEVGLTELRALIFELRPESLEQEGLVGALEKQAAAVQARHGIQVRLNLAREPALPMPTKEALYRVAQEALHNTAKHAQASTLDLALKVGEEEVALTVTDDGRGFDPDGEFPGHLGLHSMRERLAAIGGTLEIQSAPGRGRYPALPRAAGSQPCRRSLMSRLSQRRQAGRYATPR